MYLLGQDVNFYGVSWCQAQPGQCESCRKHFAMDQVGNEETAQILSINKTKTTATKNTKSREKLQETYIFLRYIIISNVG